jgi:hypothetical protein
MRPNEGPLEAVGGCRRALWAWWNLPAWNSRKANKTAALCACSPLARSGGHVAGRPPVQYLDDRLTCSGMRICGRGVDTLRNRSMHEAGAAPRPSGVPISISPGTPASSAVDEGRRAGSSVHSSRPPQAWHGWATTAFRPARSRSFSARVRACCTALAISCSSRKGWSEPEPVLHADLVAAGPPAGWLARSIVEL